MLWPRLSVVLFVWVVSILAGDRLMSPPILKGPPSSSVANYRPISITPLSKVFEFLDIGLSWKIYGRQWCSSNHPVCLSERSGKII